MATEIRLRELVGGGYDAFWSFRGRYRVVKGSRASKKSKTAALNLIYRMMRYPGANALVVRRTANTLRDSCFADLRWAAARLGAAELWSFVTSPLGATYLPTGQQIFFRGLDDPLKLASISCPVGSICWAWIEEAFEISESDFDLVDDCIRGSTDGGKRAVGDAGPYAGNAEPSPGGGGWHPASPAGRMPGEGQSDRQRPSSVSLRSTASPRGEAGPLFKQLTLTFNPWSASSWLKRRFFDGPPDPDVLAMTTTYRCNEWLDEADLRRFARMEREQPGRYRVAGLGDWGVEGGQVFEEWRDDSAHYLDRRWTHVIEPFEIPEGWRIYRGFDFGYARPFSVGWFAADHDGRLYHILELYGCAETPNTGLKWAPDKIFDEIRRIESEHRWLRGKSIRGVADPSIWDASRGVSVAETGEKCGVWFEPGDNARLPGWMQLHYRLRFDARGIPMLYVFRTCRGFLRTLPLLRYDRLRPEDVDSEGEDHIADMTRYVCMARPMTPAPKPGPRPKAWDPLD